MRLQSQGMLAGIVVFVFVIQDIGCWHKTTNETVNNQVQPTQQQRDNTRNDIMDSPRCQSEGKEYCTMSIFYVQTVMRSVMGILLETPDYSFQRAPETMYRQRKYQQMVRLKGQGRPAYGLTMVSWYRLSNIYHQLMRIMIEGIEGDFMEAGVWRGGSSIVAKAVIQAFEGGGRKVHVVDSFEGLPAPRSNFAEIDTGEYAKMDYIRVSLEQVQSNFQRYGLLDDGVEFHKGFFNESLSRFRKENPQAKISFLRLDGDMYESTTDILYNVYDFDDSWWLWIISPN
eukprot:TRINITY_DN1688_c0_g1_i7.p1 TRINITY_DN1688_c0_g1~~TRINITY_DN1688_c0_g1_i7.p1  ORF type:complete len:285 (-),score=26.82 TRINITY_DN1688_c0_g1_i7:39-893(-)